MTTTKKCTISLDSGSQSCRAAVYDDETLCLFRSEKFPIYIYREQDGTKVLSPVKDIIESAISSLNGAIAYAKDNGYEVVCLGITNQRESFAAWTEESSGKINYKKDLISWQGTHGALYPETANIDVIPGDEDRETKLAKYIYKTTGLPHTHYFSCTKLHNYIHDELKGEDLSKYRFGTVDCLILRILTGEYRTDTTNAHRTNLCNVRTMKYDEKLLSVWGLELNNLPEIRPSASTFGHIFSKDHHLFTEFGLDTALAGLQVSGMIGDQQASSLAHGLSLSTSVKLTLGTGAFISARINDVDVAMDYASKIDELCSLKEIEESAILQITPLIGYGCGGSADGKIIYMAENYVKAAGIGIAIMNRIGILKDTAEFDVISAEPLADDTPANPKLDDFVTKIFEGTYESLIPSVADLTQEDKRYICRKYIKEQVGARLANNVEVFNSYYKYDASVREGACPTFSKIYVDGGFTKSEVVRETLTDLWGSKVEFRKDPEMTVLGAAICAGLGCKKILLDDKPRTIAAILEKSEA